jgi:hypothetical protein
MIMNIDFVKTPFTNNPSMERYEGNAFNKTPNQAYLKQKKRELKLHGDFLNGESELSIDKGLRSKVINYTKAQNNMSLEELTLTIEEDFVVMHKGNMELVSVCFPSGWIPVNKLGENLSSIHAPVADSHQLLKSSEKLTEYMCKKSIRRWVWTITTYPELSNFPGLQKPRVDKLENLYFRVETQTSVPLDTETSLFFIKVQVLPLLNIWNVRILDSINSMTENVLNYKDLMQIKKLLNTIQL